MHSFKKKNKKGQVGFISLMLGILLFILALGMAFPLNQVVTGDDVMGEDGLNCSSEDISNQDKAVCTSTDSTQFLWFFVVVGLAGLLIWRIVL